MSLFVPIKCVIFFNLLLILSFISVQSQRIGYPNRQPTFSENEDITVLPCGSQRHLRQNETILIQSPNYSKNLNYPNSFVCKWRFVLHRCSLVISCPEFKLLPDFFCSDALYIQDGKPHDASRYKFCGTKGPHQLKLKHREMEFTFITSRWFTSQGFQCALTCIDEGINDEPPQIEEETPPVVVKPPKVIQLPPVTCNCGFSNVSNRIVNGVETVVGEFPWIVALKFRDEKRPFCGGSLINSRYILTASHCITRRVNPLTLEVILNEHNNQEEIEGAKPIKLSVEHILTHTKYGESAALDFDAALIKLRHPVDLKKFPPICLPLTNEIEESYEGQNATVSGWGLKEEDGSPSDELRKVVVKVLSQEICTRAYGSSITDRMLCAFELNKDSCQGDSGSPLMRDFDLGQDEGKIYKQIGIVSWGIGCAKEKPGVYSRVTELLKWIEHNTADGRYCNS